jgi:adenylate cyclase
MANRNAKIFEARYFGLLIGFAVALVIVALNAATGFIGSLETKVLDADFNLKNETRSTSIQEGVTVSQKNPKISDDIMLIGIDSKALAKFGKWPFPRNRHATLLDTFSRIKNKDDRERSVFLDVTFNEPDKNAIDDAVLIDSIRSNGKVFLETMLDQNPLFMDADTEYVQRQLLLNNKFGTFSNVSGDWQNMPSFLGFDPPLEPYGDAIHGYGHASFVPDRDKIFREQSLVAKISILKETLKLDDLKPGYSLDAVHFERLAWIDKNGSSHSISYPLTETNLRTLAAQMKAEAPLKIDDTNGDGNPDVSYYIVRKYQDSFIPSVTFALALDYFHKNLNDVEIVLGKHIRIPNPETYDQEKHQWVPYSIKTSDDVFDKSGNLVSEGKRSVLGEINIPINENGEMLINFMGLPSSSTSEGTHTFPVRSYAGYADKAPGPDQSTWPKTKALGNKILMVGAFAKGIAEDERTTPVGLMYGVEIQANALNTILMNNFIRHSPAWINLTVLFALTIAFAFLTSRTSTLWSGLAVFVAVLGIFLAGTLLFDSTAVLYDTVSPSVSIVLAFVSVVAYRAMTEERDKKHIREMFGKYVSPKVVDQILENPPELGGVDKELTVLFSDIRGFTTLSENMSPQELVNLLNEYLTAMTDLILEYGGTLDKYVGDEIMCFWGAPLPQSDHADRACKCAIAQIAKLRELNEKWPPQKRMNIGIGINSGIMTVGNMGSPGRMNYTLTGDNVNLGARLEGTNKQYYTNIIMSEFTYGYVKDDAIVRELDNIRVKGKNKPVLIYELIDFENGIEAPRQVPDPKNKR